MEMFTITETPAVCTLKLDAHNSQKYKNSIFVHSHFLYSKFDAACSDYLIIWQNV